MVRAPMSSATASVTRNNRSRVPGFGPTRASRASTKAVSVDTTTPQAWAAAVPALRTRKMTAGMANPAIAATIGTAARRRSVSSPMVSSRLTSRPTAKKNNAIKPSLTQCLRSSTSSYGPSSTPASRCQNASYVDPIGEFTQMIASSVAATRTAAEETALSATLATAPLIRWVAVWPCSRTRGRNPGVSVLTPASRVPAASGDGPSVRRSVSDTSAGLLSWLERGRHRRRATYDRTGQADFSRRSRLANLSRGTRVGSTDSFTTSALMIT